MEITNIEVARIEKAVLEAKDTQLRELSELQLAFVGGGMADTVGH